MSSNENFDLLKRNSLNQNGVKKLDSPNCSMKFTFDNFSDFSPQTYKESCKLNTHFSPINRVLKNFKSEDDCNFKTLTKKSANELLKKKMKFLLRKKSYTIPFERVIRKSCLTKFDHTNFESNCLIKISLLNSIIDKKLI